MLRDQIIEEARKYLGVKWLHQGRTMNGIDCAGLVILVGKALNLMDYDTDGYARKPNGFNFLTEFDNNMDRKKLNELQTGDVILFREDLYPCHTGIYFKDIAGREKIIHAYAKRKQVCEGDYTKDGWREKAIAAYQYRGLYL